MRFSIQAIYTIVIAFVCTLGVDGKMRKRALLATETPVAIIPLGYASDFSVLAFSTVTSTLLSGTIVSGNVGLYPGLSVTGFAPSGPAVFSATGIKGEVLIGTVESKYAQFNLSAAYTTAAATAPTKLLTGQDLGGMTLVSGVYRFATSAAMTGNLQLDANGTTTAVWIFQIASTMMFAGKMSFVDGIGNPNYVYFQVGSAATISPNSVVIGNVIAFYAITMNKGASITGRLLSTNAAVTLDDNIVVLPPAPYTG